MASNSQHISASRYQYLDSFSAAVTYVSVSFLCVKSLTTNQRIDAESTACLVLPFGYILAAFRQLFYISLYKLCSFTDYTFHGHSKASPPFGFRQAALTARWSI